MKYIVDFKNSLTNEDITNHLSSLNATIVKTYSKFEKIYVIDVPGELTLNADFHSHIALDESNPIQLLSTTVLSNGGHDFDSLPQFTINTSQQQDWWKNFVLRKPQFDVASFSTPKLGENNVVYVLDSGIKLDHPDFEGRPVSFLYSFNNNFADTNGHGTAIASVITGNTCGITDSSVKAVKIFEDGVATLQSHMLDALNAIYEDFSNSSKDFAIVNCSWIIDKNIIIENAINALIEDGLYFVCAAGNAGIPIDNVTPASMDKVITIGSYDSDLNPCDFSNYTGDLSTTANETNTGALDGWAPGKDIYIALLSNGYGYMSGTSISSGIHSAVLAANLSLYNYDTFGMSPVNFDNDNFNYTGPTVEEYYQYNVDISLNRKDLLNLENTKYNNSANRISSLIGKQVGPTEFKLMYNAIAHSKGIMTARIFLPQLTKKLEILGDLPAGMVVNGFGMLRGIAADVENPTMQTVEMIAYDLNDQAFPFTFNIITLPSAYKVVLEDIEDTEIRIRLQDNVGPCSAFGCAPTCVDNCFSVGGTCNQPFTAPTICNGTLKNGWQCACTD
ncbi:MAG: hypothetical protein EB127_22445 [Alphaproteobacteria bacterium]|nr:hypothetical protein [Alphaproteobacteria bacterium]